MAIRVTGSSARWSWARDADVIVPRINAAELIRVMLVMGISPFSRGEWIFVWETLSDRPVRSPFHGRARRQRSERS